MLSESAWEMGEIPTRRWLTTRADQCGHTQAGVSYRNAGARSSLELKLGFCAENETRDGSAEGPVKS